VGNQAAGAVLNAILGIGEVSPAFVPQRIQGTVAKQAAELPFLYALMAGKELTFYVLYKLVIFHNDHPDSTVLCLPLWATLLDYLGFSLYNKQDSVSICSLIENRENRVFFVILIEKSLCKQGIAKYRRRRGFTDEDWNTDTVLEQ
jgi:hypothetical protein